MKNIYQKSALYALLTVGYIALVAAVMTHAEQIFGQMNSVFAATIFLVLFSFSALVVSGLLVGQPLTLYIDGKKKEALAALLSTVAWLFLILVIGILTLAF